MSQERIWNRSLLLTAGVVAVVSAVSVWTAWHATDNLAARLSFLTVAPVFCAASVSYCLRILRFHYFLSRSGIAIPLRGTAVVQVVGFALSVTPGHIGEVFKLHLIRERVGTPIVRTAPLLVLDRLTEGGGFLILGMLSALTLPALWSWLPTPALLLLGLAVISGFALTLSRWAPRGLMTNPRLTRTRIWQRLAPHLQNLWSGLQTSFTPKQIIGGLAISALARFADGWVVLFSARIMGVELALPTAVFVLAVSGLAGGISFLPAGTGAVETTMVGLLMLLGATWPNALAITLFARLSTLWLWVALGLVLAFALRLTRPRLWFGEGQ